MTRDRWGALIIFCGITLFSIGIGIEFGTGGFVIGLGMVLMVLEITILIP